MNKSQVLFHLVGARLHLEELIQDIEGHDGDSLPVLRAGLPFVYRHLNQAWNTRDKSPDQLDEMEKQAREKLCRLPNDLDGLISE